MCIIKVCMINGLCVVSLVILVKIVKSNTRMLKPIHLRDQMRKLFRLILLLFVQDFGGNRRDGGCGLNEAFLFICLFVYKDE